MTVAFLMPGHSRSKNGVVSLDYGAGHPRLSRCIKARRGCIGLGRAKSVKQKSRKSR
jgi:hypothetical protein